MRVRADVLAKVAELARLRLEPEEAERLQQELSRILDHVDSLSQVDGVALMDDLGGQPSADGSAAVASFTARHPPDPLPVDPTGLAPQWEEGFFVVPRLPAMDGTAAPLPPATDESPDQGEQGG